MVQINVGAGANDGTGDPLRTAFQKVNANTTELGTSITTTSDSTFNGHKIGRGGNSTIFQNLAIGQGALRVNTSGYHNTTVGLESLFNVNVGSFNVAIGGGANYNITTGYYNTAVGYLSNSLSSIYNGCSTLGTTAEVTANNQVQLGNNGTTTYVYGTVQNRSDLRDKADVQDTVLGLDFISKLRPVDYKWDMREDYINERPIQGELSDEDFKVVIDAWLIESKLSNLEHNGTKKRNRFHHGFIAQEVKDLGFGGFQDHSVNGGEDVLSIGYDEFIAPMVKAIQELKAEIEILKQK